MLQRKYIRDFIDVPEYENYQQFECYDTGYAIIEKRIRSGLSNEQDIVVYQRSKSQF